MIQNRKLAIEVLERRDLLNADLFVNGGAKLSGISLKREAELLGWTTETLLTKSASRTRAVIGGNAADSNGALLDANGQPEFSVLFVNGGKAMSHGRVLGPSGREAIVDFVMGGGSYVGSCAGAFLAADYSQSVLHLWKGHMPSNGRGTQTVSFASTPDHPIAQFLVANGIEDMTVRNIPQLGGPRLSPDYRHPEGTVFLGEIVGASRSLRRTIGTYFAVEFQPAPGSGTMVLQSGHPEYGRQRSHTILNAAMLQYARDRSQVGLNVTLESLPVAESEPHDRITVAAASVDPPTLEPSQLTIDEPERELVFASLTESKPEEIVLRRLGPLAVDTIFEEIMA